MKEKYYLGLDVGTDSVGYAVTGTDYSLKKHCGESMWGVHLFEEANHSEERRSFRTARRRLDRRQQRVQLIRELFADEISKIDPELYIRQGKSSLFDEDGADHYSVFNDAEYTDKEYHKQYPTIHHLIFELTQNSEPHDVRLVYLACSWLVAHRGHFLSEISMDNIAAITDFSSVYSDFCETLLRRADGTVVLPWTLSDASALGELLKEKTGITRKARNVTQLLFGGKAPKEDQNFRLNFDVAVKLLCGGRATAKDLFCNDEYAEIESFSLNTDDEIIAGILTRIGDDAETILKMKAVFDWAQLAGILEGSSCISEAKIKVYDQHAKDLKFLKRFIRKYATPNEYKSIFRSSDKGSYSSYSHHVTDGHTDFAKKDEFCKFIKNIVKNYTPDDTDKEKYDDMICRLDSLSFMPKQKDPENRVIPQQLYQDELIKILRNAEKYVPSLAVRDADGMTKSEKIVSVFSFRVPYYVGPLNSQSKFAWIKRKAEGKIFPWNFSEIVDADACEQEFIRRLINSCTYLPEAKVLPKDSLLYHRFTVLNEINNIRINDQPLSVEQKQDIYTSLFMRRRKVTLKALRTHLSLTSEHQLSGIDEQIKSDLKPYHDFKRLLESGTLSEEQVEDIILHRACTDEKARFSKWLRENFPVLSEDDVKYVSSLNYKDFGRLSRKFLSGIEGSEKENGEVFTVISALWNTNDNLMQILSDRYTFADTVREIRDNYYSEHSLTLSERLDEMFLPNAVKRPVIRTLDIVKDVVKVMGRPPERIFVEMTRGKDPEPKRTQSRREQILELYKKCKDEDVRILKEQLEAMGEATDMRLRGEKLFLYFMQFGKCAYSGEPIDIKDLKDKTYDVEHIYPQAYVKDDSIINNKVLVLSKLNGEKSDSFPISSEIRRKMAPIWARWHEIGTISDEKYKRLTRSTTFSADEKQGFIQRQLVETSQSTKAVTALLKERYPESEIVFVKAHLTSDFRQEFDMLKSRTFNDLHHAKDAYLNIVTGNVYHMAFTRKWFDTSKEYSINTHAVFGKRVRSEAGEVYWNGEASLALIRATVAKNSVHCTKYAFCRHGGFFKQNPRQKAEGLIPRKADLPTELYGGYYKPTVSFFVLVKYKSGKKTETMMMPVELLHCAEFLRGGDYAESYAKQRIGSIIGKTVDSAFFPLGMRRIKINTMLSLDGFRVTIAGVKNGGRYLIAAPFMQFAGSGKTETYVKRLEEFVKKTKENPNYVYDAAFDKVTKEENSDLYDLYCEKLEKTIYCKRPSAPVGILKSGKVKFDALDIKAQSAALLNIHAVFGRVSGGCDLSAIGGTPNAAATGFSASLSNWKKNYSDVRIIDVSASGLWEERSRNLLELL